MCRIWLSKPVTYVAVHRVQLAGRLQQYEGLGPDFASLAQQYSQLMEDLRHAEFTLEEFRQAAATEDSLA